MNRNYTMKSPRGSSHGPFEPPLSKLMVDPASKTHENWLAWNSEVGKGEKFTDVLLEHHQENRYFPGDGWSAKYGDVVALKRPSLAIFYSLRSVLCHNIFINGHGPSNCSERPWLTQMTQMTTRHFRCLNPHWITLKSHSPLKSAVPVSPLITDRSPWGHDGILEQPVSVLQCGHVYHRRPGCPGCASQ